MARRSLFIFLAGPRGFCAGVDRAIQIVEKAIERYGAPVYVRHEIVHNRFVVESLEALGARFVDELDEVPDGFPVILSVPAEATRRALFYLDATCPLVSKVHHEAERHYAKDRHILLIGHAGHPEVVGTMGQLPPGTVSLVEDLEQARRVSVVDPRRLAYITQTTLSVDDTKDIVQLLQQRFPLMNGPRKEDICYATTNRQAAVKAIAPRSDAILVIGAPTASNSNRLVEVARKAGCPRVHLVQRAAEIDWFWLDGVDCLGITAGASAPETLVQEAIAACRERFEVTVEELVATREDVEFKLPRVLVGS